MLQFPPFAHTNHGPPGTSPATPGNNAPCAPGPTSDGPPGVPTRPATTGGNFVLHQLFRQREIRPIHFVQTVTN